MAQARAQIPEQAPWNGNLVEEAAGWRREVERKGEGWQRSWGGGQKLTTAR